MVVCTPKSPRTRPCEAFAGRALPHLGPLGDGHLHLPLQEGLQALRRGQGLAVEGQAGQVGVGVERGDDLRPQPGGVDVLVDEPAHVAPQPLFGHRGPPAPGVGEAPAVEDGEAPREAGLKVEAHRLLAGVGEAAVRDAGQPQPGGGQLLRGHGAQAPGADGPQGEALVRAPLEGHLEAPAGGEGVVAVVALDQGVGGGGVGPGDGEDESRHLSAPGPAARRWCVRRRPAPAGGTRRSGRAPAGRRCRRKLPAPARS